MGMAVSPSDLEPVQVALLGVLSAGLPPSRAAGSDTFRVDHVTAVITALGDGHARAANLLDGSEAITPEFRSRLREAILDLESRGIVTQQAAGMPAAAGGYEAGLAIDLVNPDEQPVVLDRYLAQMCMEALFNIPPVYPYLMERYAAAGEVWRRIREGGYAAD